MMEVAPTLTEMVFSISGKSTPVNSYHGTWRVPLPPLCLLPPFSSFHPYLPVSLFFSMTVF